MQGEIAAGEGAETISPEVRAVARAVVAARGLGPMPDWFGPMARSVVAGGADEPAARQLLELLGAVEAATPSERARGLRALRVWAARVIDEPVAERVEPPPEPAAEGEVVAVGLRPDAALADLPVDDDVVDRLEAAGVATAYDLLAWAPVTERVWTPVFGAGRALPGGRVAVGGRARLRTSTCSPDGAIRSAVLLHGAGPLRVRWAGRFNASDLLRMPHDGKVTVLGDVDGEALVNARLLSAAQGHAFELRWHGDDAADAAHAEALALIDGEPVLDLLPEPWPARLRVPALADAVAAARARGRGASQERRRLALDELILLQLGQALQRVAPERGFSHPISHGEAIELERMGAEQPLNDGQQAAFEDIKRDLRGPRPMLRLLAGPADAQVEDVALRATLLALAGRSQVLVVCHEPQTALVRHTLWEPVLRRLGYASLLLSGEPRRSDAEALRKAEVHVVVAPPAVFEQSLEWRRLGLVVVMEQASYGGLSALAANLRPPRPDVLITCRTPLAWPRYLDVMGGIDLSWVASSHGPPAAGTVWAEVDRDAAYVKLGEAARAGRPVVIAFPLTRGGTDLLDLRVAALLIGKLRDEVFGGVEIGLFHGALPADERRAVLDAFYQRRVPVLVATTTLEIARPHAAGAVIMLEHSDRMDPQRLLGWRAFAGPSGELHYVIGQDPRPIGERTVTMLAARLPDPLVCAAIPDAFPGDATEAPALGWVEPERDLDLIVASRRVVHTILRADPGLRAPEHARLARVAHARWARWRPDANPIPAPSGGRKRRRRRKR